MREIKFRARGASAICWIYGYFIRENGFCYIVNEYGKHQVRADSICEFTGLKDKNGKEIYEWDIVHFDGTDKYFTFMVTWKHLAFSFININSHSSENDLHPFNKEYSVEGIISLVSKKFKIIGNIYENQELLK